ncbi:hypothetical protein ACWCQZ_06290 [Streptomyces sp. NPDC002285]|uniref:hypothetical protein n=1 Tax=Streptomyces sp. NPDC056468 TaxID=3345830 RepID=UPI00369E2A1D
MKLRHVRAVAVCVGVVVALTGARHSSGGGCDSNSNSSSSSSSSGGTSGGSTHYDDDDDDYDTGSSSSGGVESEGPSAEDTTDVKIEKCEYDAVEGLVARVRATNSSTTTTYSYTFTVTFKDSAGTAVDTATSGILTVDAGATDTIDVVARQSVAGGSCELGDAMRMSDHY